MVEVINRLCSKESISKAKLIVHHYLRETDFFDEFHKNDRAYFIFYAKCVHNDRDYFTLSLADQTEQGMSCKDVQFVTKENCHLF